MLRTIAAAFAALALIAPAARAQAPEPEPVQVMVLGAYHFDNPGLDINNMQVDPVTTPEKQVQLEAVAEALARFQPTAIALERIAADPSTMLDHRYPEFTPAALLTNADERVQIGYRLADRLGLDRVYAVDEQTGEGDRDYFPYGPMAEWAATNGRAEDLSALNEPIQTFTAEIERRQRTDTIGAILRIYNDPDHPVMGLNSQQLYYGFLRFGSGENQTGAALNGGWYERNARIFAKLIQVAQPGDRIVLLFGAGHGYWLRHFVETTPGFVLVEANDYLPN